MKRNRELPNCRGVGPLHRSSIRSLILVVAAFFVWGCNSSHIVFASEQKSPNIVLIVIDTLRSDLLGCYGAPGNPSPELDLIANEGVRVETAIAPCSWTRPSIGAMLTSQYPRTLGLYEEQNEILNDRFTTLAEVLKENGYRTIGVTANPVINSVFNMHQGFDKYEDSHIIFTWMKGASESQPKRSFRRFNKLPSAPEVFARALELIGSETIDQPIYLQLNLMEIHEAWRPFNSLTRKEFKGRFKGLYGKRYLQSLAQVSADTGNFIATLRQRPGFDNTLFVITSDHGQGLNDHPNVATSSFHGRIIYESQVKVPQIFYHPNGNIQKAVIKNPVRLLDLLPTLLDYCELSPLHGVEGVSFAPLLKGEKLNQKIPKEFFVETYYRKYRKAGVYSAEWIYVENRDDHKGVNAVELQSRDTKANGKKTDRSAEFPDIVSQMQRKLQKWESEHPEELPTPYSTGISDQEIEQLESIGYVGH